MVGGKEQGPLGTNKKSKAERPCFLCTRTPYLTSLWRLVVDFQQLVLLAGERQRLHETAYPRARSYFLPRLGPGPISTRDSEISPVPNADHVAVGTLATPRQIVTMIMLIRRKFMRLQHLDKANRLKNSQPEGWCCFVAVKATIPAIRLLGEAMPPETGSRRGDFGNGLSHLPSIASPRQSKLCRTGPFSVSPALGRPANRA